MRPWTIALCALLLLTFAAPACLRNGARRMTDEVALVRGPQLLVRTSDGAERVVLTTPAYTFPAYPAWSPDGALIAYALIRPFIGQADANWGGDVYVVDSRGSQPRLVWGHERQGEEVQGLVWSPDGASLLFGYQFTVIQNGRTQRAVQQIERISVGDGTRAPVVQGGQFPSLSRDGRRLAYIVQNEHGQGGLFVSGPAGDDAKQVVELAPKFLSVLYPRISPDGGTLVFAAYSPEGATPTPRLSGATRKLRAQLMPHPAEAHGYPMELWHLRISDNRITQLTKFGEDEPCPSWSSDGKTLMVAATGGVYQMGADGSDLKKLGPGGSSMQIDLKSR
jgi:Tol biopolymer transport system component